MHRSVYDFVRAKVDQYDLRDCSVLELGSLNVNGTVRDHFRHGAYLGVDLVAGPGVDAVISAHDVDTGSAFDVVLCLEMLEHDADPNATFATIARCLADEGVALVTTRSEGFPIHHEPDLWRFTHDDIRALAYTAGLNVVTVIDDPQVDHPGVFAVLTKA